MGQVDLGAVWIHSSAVPDCGGCIANATGAIRCRPGGTGQPCLSPVVEGPAEKVREVIGALNLEVVDPTLQRGMVDLHMLRSLTIANGQADLTVTFAPSCGGGRQMTEAAFQTLRRLLPDTDIYVHHNA